MKGSLAEHHYSKLRMQACIIFLTAIVKMCSISYLSFIRLIFLYTFHFIENGHWHLACYVFSEVFNYLRQLGINIASEAELTKCTVLAIVLRFLQD